MLFIFSLFLDKSLSNSIINLFKLEFFFYEVRFSLYINIEVTKVFYHKINIKILIYIFVVFIFLLRRRGKIIK